MKAILEIYENHPVRAISEKVKSGKATKEDMATLHDLQAKSDNELEARFYAMQGIAKALQVAFSDEDTGIFDEKIDHFNVAFWLESEAANLHELYRINRDAAYLIAQRGES
ncbi:MAG: hypothetical protein RI556_11220 [Hydrogenovibrio sp.]|uniref:hypothetical protein n=1 Tax=Hydrogenovibrio sp. TaxID=2065821 RepID=UPI00287072B1|nr:hypothetical protein [Hydrogenovibrio sp.]MDR9499736.1 hypothetical protein [Hydrogenovibrio sp.]